MALITRCPNCATTFRVTPLHLQAHGGEVRCGRCAQIFNGFASLATMREPEAVDLPKTTAAGMPNNTSETPAASDPAPSALSDQEIPPSAPSHRIREPKVAAETVTREPADQGSAAAEEPAPKISGTANGRIGGAQSRLEEPAAQISSTTSAFEDPGPESYEFDGEQSTKTSALGWGFASLFLLVVLAAQAVYFYRAELSAIVPDARPYLEQYCELLDCIIPSPQNSRLLNIESSEMQSDAQYPGAIILIATVRNYASYPQTFPLFELTLTDPQDRPLASRIFAPDTYLEKNSNPSGVIASNYEFNVRLYLDSGNLNAAGYRLFLFYPAA